MDDRDPIPSRSYEGIRLFPAASRRALGPTQSPNQQVSGVPSTGAEQPARESDHSAPSSAEVKNAWSYTSTHSYVFMEECLIKHRDFTFYLYLTKYYSYPFILPEDVTQAAFET
jgi:hypothetical protein